MREFNKIFHIGLNRTGSRSLVKALYTLGIPAIHYNESMDYYDPSVEDNDWIRTKKRLFDKKEFEMILSLGRNPLKELGLDTQFDAFFDYPFLTQEFLKKIPTLYSNSLFIYLQVEFEDYWKSRVNRYKIQNGKGWDFDEYKNFDDFLDSKNTFKTIFDDTIGFTEKIILNNKKENVLIMNIITGDGWDKLCKFLNMDIPNKSFPHIGHHRQRGYGIKTNVK
jgi:hypothetical protein